MPTLNEIIDPDLNAKNIVHTSGYAQAASGGTIGAASTGLSMDQRRKLMYGRQTVGSYAQSQLGRRYGAAKARTADQARGRLYDASTDGFTDKAHYGRNRPQGKGAVAEPKIDSSIARRQAPPASARRGYDPFG